MDAKQVEEANRQITKAVSGGDPPSTIVALLDGLKPWKASEQLLRQTKIGVNVNKLRQHKDQSVARKATQLVTKWKDDVKKPGGAKGTSSPATAKVAETNGTSSPAPGTPKQEASKTKWNGNAEKRTAAGDGAEWKSTDNATRDACVKLMYDGLAFMSYEPTEDILRVACSVELAAYTTYSPETSQEYKTRIRSLFQNLKNKSNPGLRTNVLNGRISPDRFVTMTHEELKSDKMRAEDDKLQKENMDKAMIPQEQKSISASLTCGKCGQKKVSYSQAQTRSADEPMTTFCECTVCGNRWKFS